MPSHLSKFLSAAKNTKAREQLLESKVIYDLMLAAAKRGYGLLSYKSATDTDGFDVVLDDRQTLIPIQLKTVSGSTKKWEIHRTLIRPKIDDLEMHQLYATFRHMGRAGGIILSSISIEGEDIEVQYYYSDFLIIELLCHGIVERPKKQLIRIEQLRRELIDEAKGKVEYPICAFVGVKSPEELLAIAGLQSKAYSLWRGYFQEYLRFQNIPEHTSHLCTKSEALAYVKEHIPALIR
jgi:hypothetical protein